MTIIQQVKTNFTGGEINRRLLGRGDLKAYDNGALTLKNVFIHPTGGVSRRAGFAFIDTVPGIGRLIPFEFNTDQLYLIVVTDELITIYQDGTEVTTVSAPWEEDQIKAICWTQSADTLLLCHPEVAPKQLTRNADTTWSLNDWEYFADPERSNALQQPYYRFEDADITLTPDATGGNLNVTASDDVFVSDHIGTRFRIQGKEVEIHDVVSATHAIVTTIEGLVDTQPTKDWEEQVFSDVRGYPVTAAFHQDRLVIGGSRDLPNRLWFSKTGDLFNFDLGDGLDDEGIEFGVFSDQVNAIRGIFSGRDLQVMTSGGEWLVTGTPLTPSTVQLTRQTRIGSRTDRYVPPVDVDGATMFVSRNGNEIREFLFTDVEAAYQAADLSLLSKHIVSNIIDQSFDPDNRLLLMVRGDGKISVLTLYRTEKVTAWSLLETDGDVKAVTVVGEDSYILVDRDGTYTIELMDPELNLDSALSGYSETPTTSWSGLDHLEGETVSIVADGEVQTSQTVSSGAITLSSAASDVDIGLPFTHVVEPLPPNILSDTGAAKTVRMIQSVFRIEETSALKIDTGDGLQDITLRDTGDYNLSAPDDIVSADICVRALGWRRDLDQPLWRIEQSDPLPFTLLSVKMELKIGF